MSPLTEKRSVDWFRDDVTSSEVFDDDDDDDGAFGKVIVFGWVLLKFSNSWLGFCFSLCDGIFGCV